MPNWKKVITSGSDATLTSVTATAGFTGSLQGTASYATNALSSSYALTASYSNNLQISGSINNVNYIDFNTGSAIPAWQSGRIFWDNTEQALSVYNSEADITLQVGQENWARVWNASGVTIHNGDPVRLSGTHGDAPQVVLAQSVLVSGSVTRDNQILGLATHDIEINTFGYVTTKGLVRGLNTNAYADGDRLYVSSSAGQLTKIPPAPPYELIPAGFVVKASPGGSGIIYSDPYQPVGFSDLNSAEKGTTYSYGDLWTYAKSGSVGVWRHTNQLSGSYIITGSLNATSFTGSLLGTASYATNALSASYAPSTPTFPYTGSAIISGSLEITGSLLVQDINGKTNIDSLNRQLYVAPPLPPGASSVLSVDWGSRTLNDSSGNSAVAWRNRDLLTSNGTNIGLDWTDNTYLSSDVYQRDYKSLATQDAVSTNYNNPNSSYLGDIIEADGTTTFIDSTVTDGMLVYLFTDAKWYPVDQASTSATRLLGIAHNVYAPSGTGYVLLEGHVVIDDTAISGPYVSGSAYGAPVYIEDSTTTGTMSTAVPTTTGGPNIVRVLGHCYQQNSGTSTQWMMKFRPSNDWVEI